MDRCYYQAVYSRGGLAAAAAELVEVVACQIAAAGTLAVAECLIYAAVVGALELTVQAGCLDAGIVDLHSIVAAASH